MTESVVIAGGGLAGGAAACLLARAGRKVVLLERETGPVDKICGEFLSIEAQTILRDLGLDLLSLGAQPIDRVRLIRRGACVETALPFGALGLSRKTLDEALLLRAASLGAQVRRGQTINEIKDAEPITLNVAGREPVTTATLFLATGKHEVRGERRSLRAEPEDLVGFKAYFQLAPRQDDALRGYVEVMMWPDAYAGLQRVEGGRANLCMLVKRSRLLRAGGNWDILLQDLCATQPHLASRLQGATALSPRPISIFRVPFGFVHRASKSDKVGVFRLGDQIGVIPSFTGDGMSIALHSAIVASDYCLRGLSAAAYHRQMRKDIAPQIACATGLYGLMANSTGQALIMMMTRHWPRLLALMAALTRIPERALGKSSVLDLGQRVSSDGDTSPVCLERNPRNDSHFMVKLRVKTSN